MGGINENAPLRIYDLEGNVHGSAPNLEYAQQFCKFYQKMVLRNKKLQFV